MHDRRYLYLCLLIELNFTLSFSINILSSLLREKGKLACESRFETQITIKSICKRNNKLKTNIVDCF